MFITFVNLSPTSLALVSLSLALASLSLSRARELHEERAGACILNLKRSFSNLHATTTAGRVVVGKQVEEVFVVNFYEEKRGSIVRDGLGSSM